MRDGPAAMLVRVSALDRCLSLTLVSLAACGARAGLDAPIFEASGGAGGAALGGGGVGAAGGAGGQPQGFSCEPGGPVVTLVEGVVWPFDLEVDGTHVYFTTYDGAEGGVHRVPREGGGLETLVDGLDHPSQLELIAGTLYVSETGANRIVRLPTGGGALEVVATGQGGPAGLASDGERLYWANYLSDEIVTSRLDGSDRFVLGVAIDPYRIAVDAERVYFTALGADVRWIDKDGGAQGSIASSSPRSVATQGGIVYWTDGGVLFSDLDGPLTSFGDLEDGTFWDGLFVDARHAFATVVDTGHVVRFSLEGESPLLVADGQDVPALVTADDTCVYWTDTGSGRVVRAPRE